MLCTPLLRRLLPLSAGFLLLLALPAPSAHADDAAPFDAAWRDLEMLEDMLDDKDATNGEIRTYMNLALATAMKEEAPAFEGEDADKQKEDWLEELEKFRGEVQDLYLEALDETHIDRSGRNEREEINEHAGLMLVQFTTVLDDGERKRLTRRILRKLKRIERARYDVSASVYEAAFKALAATGRPEGLEWLMENYLHTRKKPEEIARLRAAMRAMRTYDTIEPKLRLELADEMIKRYVAMEDLANTSTTDVSALAAKRFWDGVRTDAIPLMQYVSGYPVHADGTAIATMAGFREWLREHDNVRKAPWTEPLRRPDGSARVGGSM